MKKLFLIITMVSGFTIATQAQKAVKSPEQRATHITQTLQRKLHLTADQATQVHDIMLDQASRTDSLKSLMTNSAVKPDHKAIRAIGLDTQQKLSTVLTADQMNLYESWKANRKEKMQEKRNNGETTAPATPSTQA